VTLTRQRTDHGAGGIGLCVVCGEDEDVAAVIDGPAPVELCRRCGVRLLARLVELFGPPGSADDRCFAVRREGRHRRS
jgi:hypothetical protein